MKTILVSVLLMLATGIFGQQIKFYRTFPKPDWDYSDAVIERSDGNYLMAGSSRSQYGTDYDISLILVDPQGNTIWDKYLGQADSMEFAYSLMETSDGNYLVSGRIGMGYPYLSLFDINGDLILDMRYPEAFQGYGAFSVGETAEGNYYFIETGAVSTLYLVNQTGGIIWTKAFESAYCRAVIQTSDQGFMIVGFRQDQFENYGNIMIRTNTEGDTTWTKTIPVPGFFENNSVIQLEDNGFLIAGSYDDPEIFDEDPMTMLIRTDSEGDTLWTRNHWVGSPIYIRECRFHSGYILSSRLYISPGGIYPVIYYLYITRLDNEGNMIWSQRFDGYTYNISNNVTQTSDGGFLITGHIIGDPVATDAVLIKLDSLGDYVLTTKETEFVEFPQVLTYPVPAKDILHFRMAENNLEIEGIRIFDISGAEVNIVPDLSGNEMKLNLAGFTSGIYFYRLTTRNNGVFEGKFLVAD